uniref:Uncharacterized protein n=1 Tax=Urocitellus parryii TaxID=9999 RepID=A0A8D2HU70_UROPR
MSSYQQKQPFVPPPQLQEQQVKQPCQPPPKGEPCHPNVPQPGNTKTPEPGCTVVPQPGYTVVPEPFPSKVAPGPAQQKTKQK